MQHINVEEINEGFFIHFPGLGTAETNKVSHYRASTTIELQTDMGVQTLTLGANGSTRAKAIEHLEGLVKKTIKAMELITELPKKAA